MMLIGAGLFAIASCAEFNPVQNATSSDEITDGKGSRIEILNLGTETDTKVTLADRNFAWQEGDTIAVWTGKDDSHGSYKECIVAANGSLPVTLQEGESRFHYALYPASIRVEKRYNDTLLRVTLPDSYAYDKVCGDTVRTPMIAVNNNGSSDLVFYNLASMLRLTVTLPKSTKKLKIKFHSLFQDHLDRHISGEFLVGTPSEPVVVGTSCIRRSNQLAGGVDSIFITNIHDIPESDSTITVNIPIPIYDKYNDFSISAWDNEGKAIKAEIVHFNTDYNATRAHGMRIQRALTQGTFAIDGGKYCIFSPANLMYVYDENKDTKDCFVFHEHEYDICDSPTYTKEGTFDKFRWGTAGYNYDPWGYDYAGNCDLQTSPNGWGVDNKISTYDKTKTYKKETWVTPSKNDWYNIYKNDSAIYTGKINDVQGYILLPYAYSGTLPTGKSTYISNFNTNTYTTETWAPMKQAGAVFLPIAYYWLSTDHSGSINSYAINGPRTVSGNYYDPQYFELSRTTQCYVRLIHIL